MPASNPCDKTIIQHCTMTECSLTSDKPTQTDLSCDLPDTVDELEEDGRAVSIRMFVFAVSDTLQTTNTCNLGGVR